MSVSVNLDRAIAICLPLGILLGSAATGEGRGIIEYCCAMLLVIGICALLRLKPMFLTGVSFSLLGALLLALYFGVWGSGDRNGFGMLILYSALGGGLLATIFVGLLARSSRFSAFGPWAHFLIGLAGMHIGFLVGLGVVFLW